LCWENPALNRVSLSLSVSLPVYLAMDRLILHSGGRSVAHTFFAVGLIVAVIALEPLNITVTFERDNVGGNAV
jgi:hypothetical protein